MDLSENGLETIIATFLLLRENGNTLMLHRNKDPFHFMYGKWTPPGGKFNPGENREQCVRREYQEETDLTLGEIHYRGKVFFDNKNRNFLGKPAKFNFLVYVFEAYSHSGVLKKECKEGSLHWVPDYELRTLEVEKGDLYIFDLLDQKMTINHRIILSDKDVKIESLV